MHILCIHHQSNNIGTTNQIDTINTTIENLKIPQYHTHTAPPTPPNTKVNKNTKWNKLTYPPHNLPNTWVDPLPNFVINTTPKFLPQYSYYTDGSFLPPKEAEDGHWKKKKAGYGIYNPSKPDVQISKRLPGLQTCFRAELMAIHDTLLIITTKYTNEPAHIFTDCVNCIHVLNTQLKHPTQQNNHADKTILEEMVKMLKQRTQPTTIYKVKAHTKINGNEHADQLAKEGTMKRGYQFAVHPHEFAHTSPYYFQKDI
jgi:ribonuclease HI